jgi:hypothetical protein
VASVRFVTTWRVTLGCAVLALAAAACSGDDGDAGATTTTEAAATTTAPTTTTVPERPPSTTTTAFAPTTVEGEVEAAYLRSWDVYAEAVYNLELDEAALSSVYADEALQTQRDEIEQRIRDREPSLVRVDHKYQVVLSGASAANVIDEFTNHQVLVDPDTRQAIEPDPNETQVINFSLRLINGSWRITHLERFTG